MFALGWMYGAWESLARAGRGIWSYELPRTFSSAGRLVYVWKALNLKKLPRKWLLFSRLGILKVNIDICICFQTYCTDSLVSLPWASIVKRACLWIIIRWLWFRMMAIGLRGWLLWSEASICPKSRMTVWENCFNKNRTYMLCVDRNST